MESITRQTLSVAEAAEVLGISRAHAYDCVRSGELPSITLGRRVVILVERSKSCSLATPRRRSTEAPIMEHDEATNEVHRLASLMRWY